MIIKKERTPELSELEVVIRYQEMSGTVKKIENLLYAMDYQLVGTGEDGAQMQIPAGEVFYIESVDKQSFLYCENSVYASKQRLYQLEESLEFAGFVRVSKSCIVNIHYVKGVKPLRNSRIEAELTNQEKILVNRKYIPDIVRVLEEMKS